MRRSKPKQRFHKQTVLLTLALCIIMNNGFSFDSPITCSELFRVSWVHVRLTPWALEPFLVGVLSAAAVLRKLPHTILIFVSQRFEPCGRRCSVRPHTVRRPRLALCDGARESVSLEGCTPEYHHKLCGSAETRPIPGPTTSAVSAFPRSPLHAALRVKR